MKMTKTSKAYCGECKYCNEPNTPHWSCEYYMKVKMRRGCPVGMCDKFVKREKKEKHRISYGKGKGFN